MKNRIILFLLVSLLAITLLTFLLAIKYESEENNSGKDKNMNLTSTEKECTFYHKVVGNSMNPAINSSNFVEVDECFPVNKLIKGDIIVFRANGMLVGHRIMDINFTYRTMVTLGDNNEGADSRISFDRYVGKIIYVGIV